MGSPISETGDTMLMPFEQLQQDLYRDLLTLNQSVWERKVPRPAIEKWLDNFLAPSADEGQERLHALYLLSRFIYFGERELRELLKSLYRDLYRQPVVSAIRKRLNDTLDQAVIDAEFKSYMASTRFVGIGGPAESGTHLLYKLRQVNVLPQGLFLTQDQILITDATSVKLPPEDQAA